MSRVKAISAVGYTVQDTEQTIKFLQDTLQVKVGQSITVEAKAIETLFNLKAHEGDLKMTPVFVIKECIYLFEFLNVKHQRKIPVDTQSNDLWFQHVAVVTNDMSKTYTHLKKVGVQHVSTRPQTLPEYLGPAAGVAAFYFRDPNEQHLELISFPPQKTAEKWKNKTSKTILGIDHTAIAVSHTEKSLSFYKDMLGMEIAGGSENYGTEQEHLNQVFGCRVNITSLTAEQGMGVEFLEYIAPPGGRPIPPDHKIIDLWSWIIMMKVADLEMLHQKLVEAEISIVSKEIKAFAAVNASKALVCKDPDGHLILLFEE